jgi:hypothetical protein
MESSMGNGYAGRQILAFQRLESFSRSSLLVDSRIADNSRMESASNIAQLQPQSLVGVANIIAGSMIFS